MDTVYIIKSGDLRYAKPGGSAGSRGGFSAKISLKTAYKMGKLATAEKFLADRRVWTRCYEEEVVDPIWLPPARIAARANERAQWRVAYIAEVNLIEA